MFRTQIMGYFTPRLKLLRVHTGFHHLHTLPTKFAWVLWWKQSHKYIYLLPRKEQPMPSFPASSLHHHGECTVGTLSPSIVCRDKKEEMLLVLNLNHWSSWDSASSAEMQPHRVNEEERFSLNPWSWKDSLCVVGALKSVWAASCHESIGV